MASFGSPGPVDVGSRGVDAGRPRTAPGADHGDAGRHGDYCPRRSGRVRHAWPTRSTSRFGLGFAHNLGSALDCRNVIGRGKTGGLANWPATLATINR